MTMPITIDELKVILNKHAAWLRGEVDGECANLQDANLQSANLQDANLWCANLRGANLQDANLWCANLRGANLQGANLRCANLQSANLRDANLILIGQDIRGYLFYAWQDDAGVVIIRAGCREITGISAARAHWTERHTDDAVLHVDCLSLVDRCERMAAVRRWKLEPEEIL